MNNDYDELVFAIANKQLGIKTLKERKSDSLDFYELSVWAIESALKEAIRVGIDIGINTGSQARPAVYKER
ncbi:MAG: DUF6900 domain-containing protein [Planctomycetota bacterium]|jgi:hypothetical protein